MRSMRYDKADGFIRAALDVVMGTDPELYAAMLADNWRVTTDFDVLARAAHFDPFMAFMEGIEFRENTFGTTVSDKNPGIRRPVVVLNPRLIRQWAAENNESAESAAAATLAHEYAHIHQPPNQEDADPRNEIPAYRAGIAFADKLADGKPVGDRQRENLAQFQAIARDEGIET